MLLDKHRAARNLPIRKFRYRFTGRFAGRSAGQILSPNKCQYI